MTIGKTITRDGIPVIAAPNICMQAFNWSWIGNTQITTSPFSVQSQTNELAGGAWVINFEYPPHLHCDENIGKLRAFLVKLRGAAGRFFAYDPTNKHKRCGLLGRVESKSMTIKLPAIAGGLDYLYPATDLYAATTLYPSATHSLTGWPEYAFTVTVSINYAAPFVVTQAANAGDAVLNVTQYAPTETISISNAWNYSLGVRPEYEDAKTNAIEQLRKQFYGKKTPNLLLLTGAFVQIDDHLTLITDDFITGQNQINIAQPLVHPVLAGTAIDIETAGTIFRLSDNAQARWRVNGSIHESISFEAIEATYL